MKAMEFNIDNRVFGGLFGVIADSLGRKSAETAPRTGQLEPSKRESILQSLDRWLWKQQMRETEAYLAQSKDIFELEARMRHLERGRSQI